MCRFRSSHKGAVAGAMVGVSVSDSGEGISAEALPHIWQRFGRSSQAHSPGCNGIGLILVKELVEMMGGTVGVESQAGPGSLFLTAQVDLSNSLVCPHVGVRGLALHRVTA